MSDEVEKKEGSSKIGKGFNINDEKIDEIETLIGELIDEGLDHSDIEKAIDQKYLSTGETFIAGFLLCFKLAGKRLAQENIIRRKISDFMHGYHTEPINPLEINFITNLIDSRVIAGIDSLVELEDEETVVPSDEKVIDEKPADEEPVVVEKKEEEPVAMSPVSKEEKEKNYDDAVNEYIKEVEQTTKVESEPEPVKKKKGLIRKMRDTF